LPARRLPMPSAGPRTARANARPRYEFRIWAPSLAEVRARLDRLTRHAPIEHTRETYIVSDATSDANVKIRAGLMDIKTLLRVESGLERWNAYLKADFPIDATLIARQILPALRVDLPALPARVFTAEEFIDGIVKPHRRLTAVEVVKSRRHYPLGASAAEFVEIEIAGRSLQSVAVESASARAALDAIGKLAIGGQANISYVRQIKSMLARG
jgi:hypothetical protein